MSCDLSEEELWSRLDDRAPGLEEHLTTCPACKARVDQLRAGLRAFTRVSTPPQSPLPARIGSYRIHRRLGEGGMGLVYEGEQQSPKRRVAIKVVRGGQCGDDYLVRLFQREVQALGRLKHAAIASIFEAGRTDDGQHFFVMELVSGVPLTRYVQAHDVPLRERLALFRRICEAIHYAHQVGVIHRDLKPTNILVDAAGNPKVLDFGLASITDPDVDPEGTVTVGGRLGTPAYMSPEEALGRPDKNHVRTDVYSLGVILYQLLTGELPYHLGNTNWEGAKRIICEQAPRRPAGINRAVRGDLATIVLKALEKEPARRYQSAGLIAEDIERFLTDQPILARRASTLYRFRKLVVRHKSRFMLLAIFVAVFGAKYWLDRWSEQTVARALKAVEQGDAWLAMKAQTLGSKHHEDKEYAHAERQFREALTIYERLGKSDPRRAGETRLALGSLLGLQPAATEEDCLKAEELLWAAIEVFEEAGPEWYPKRREAFEALRVTLTRLRELYGPDELDDPETVADLDLDLEAIDARMKEEG